MNKNKNIPIALVDKILNLLDALDREYHDFREYVETWLEEKKSENE